MFLFDLRVRPQGDEVAVLEPAEQDERAQAEVHPLDQLVPRETPLANSEDSSRADLDEFVACYRPEDRHSRRATWSEATPEARWRPYGYEEILVRDKVSLDIFWLRDESLEDSASLPDPRVIAQEIADDHRLALARIEDVLGDLEQRVAAGTLEE